MRTNLRQWRLLGSETYLMPCIVVSCPYWVNRCNQLSPARLFSVADSKQKTKFSVSVSLHYKKTTGIIAWQRSFNNHVVEKNSNTETTNVCREIQVMQTMTIRFDQRAAKSRNEVTANTFKEIKNYQMLQTASRRTQEVEEMLAAEVFSLPMHFPTKDSRNGSGFFDVKWNFSTGTRCKKKMCVYMHWRI